MNYYVYMHIRLDTNSIFYIGKGKKKENLVYERAYSRKNRNKHWKNIVNKTEWKYELIREFFTEQEALDYETKIINMFGIHSEGGQLCNLVKDSRNSNEITKIALEANKKPIHKYSLEGLYIESYDSIIEAAIINNCDDSALVKCCKGKSQSHRKFQWRYYKTEMGIGEPTTKKIKVYQYDLQGNFIAEYASYTKAAKAMNTKMSCIHQVVNDDKRTSHGYQWRTDKSDKIQEFLNNQSKQFKIKNEFSKEQTTS